MRAEDTKLQQLLEGTKQYIVPLFQRVYCWEKKQWIQLWKDLLDIYEMDNNREHFTGAIVTMPVDMQPHGVNKFLLIDGQQRLTTIFIILAVMRDIAASTGNQLSEHIQESYFFNRRGQGSNRIKLLPTEADRQSFANLVDGKMHSSPTLIREAYKFFERKLSGVDTSGNSIDLERLHDVMMQELVFVSVVLGRDDSPYRIFHSLNGKGVPLEQADLIRNHFFMLMPDESDQQIAYDDLWLPMQDKLGENLNDFIWYYLLKDGTYIRYNETYDEIKSRATGKNQQQTIDTLLDMHTFSDYYHRLIDPSQEPHSGISYHLRRINRWQISTAYPFLLNIYHDYTHNRLSADQVCQVIDQIESFVIRRFFCRVPTNALNGYFVSIYRALDKNNIVRSTQEYLLARNWPNDEDFVRAWERLPIYLSGTKKCRHILESLEEALNTNHEPVNLKHSRITIEHVMPQTLNSNWEIELGDNVQTVHNLYLHTVGNLTLTGMNETLGNTSFKQKQQVFLESNFTLNKHFETCPTWNKEAIQQRAYQLGNTALQIWLRPV